MNKQLRSSLMIVVATIFWGSSFVAQEEGAGLGAFAFNGIRFLLGSVIVAPLFFISRRKEIKSGSAAYTKKDIMELIKGGVICGLCLALASNLQQFGVMVNSGVEGSSGKAGFITALYIVFVPLLGVFAQKKLRPSVVISVVFGLAGLYFISIKDNFSIDFGDIFLILCAFAYSFHIIVIDTWSLKINCFALSSAQFAVTGIISLILSAIFEKNTVSQLTDSVIPILYCGVFSAGVAFTLQTIAQKDCEPTVASLIMSLESLFAMISASIFYGMLPTFREVIGGACMMIAIFTVETPYADRLFARLKKVKKNV